MPGLARVDLLKIDVEGAEMAVLQGLDDEHWPLVRNIVLEVCDADSRGLRAGAEKLLRDRGFRVTSVRAEWAAKDLPMYTLTGTRD
ncbi:hypothetical protein E4U21_003755 [Claviceps maximensis]|nr:hypothetical protein E4U21_003755 [Claviceps maximensis]